jgi:hypothetical protein
LVSAALIDEAFCDAKRENTPFSTQHGGVT